MTLSRLVLRLGVFITLTFGCITGASAQTWKQIGNLPAGADLRCAYFWDTSHGVVGGANCIYTYNSGTWVLATYPEQPDTIRSLRLLDGINLYAASGSSCIWESTDRGVTWQKTTALLPKADDIYLDTSGKIRGMNLLGNRMMQGTSFARLDAFKCAAAIDDASNSVYSSNGGTTWLTSKNNFEGGDGYSCVANPCANIFYTLTDGVKCELWSSSNGGDNWSLIFDFDQNAIDVMDGGIGGVLYVQGKTNIYRSVNGGKQFTTIGGPASILDDRRMFAFGVLDRSLVVMRQGAVWLWDDSIANTVGELLSVRSGQIPVNRTCDSVPVPFIITTSICAGLPELVSIDSASSIPFLPLDSALSNLGTYQYIDTVWFQSSQQWPSTLSYALRFHGHTQSGTSFDTTITMTITAEKPADPFASIVPIKKYTCTDARIPMIIRTPPCGVWHIDSTSIFSTTNIAFIDNLFDSILGPNEIDTIWLTSELNTPGAFYGEIGLYMSSLSAVLSYDTILPIGVLVRTIAPSISANAHLSISNCKNSIVPIILQAPPCDSVEFTSCMLSISGTVNYSNNLVFPLFLAPGASDTLLLTFPPQNLSGTYVISIHAKGTFVGSQLSFDTTVQIRVTFTNASSSLVSDENSFNFSSIGICGDTATAVTFTNSGCDTITVTSDETVWQPGWSATDPQFPLTLPPDSSFTVQIHFKPTALSYVTQSVTYGFVGLGSVTGTAQLAFSGSAVPAVASFTMSDTTFDFGTFGHCTLAEGDTVVTITNTGCDSLLLSGASVDAGSGFTLLGGNDTTLGPNQSARYLIHYSDSGVGSFHSAFHIKGVGAHNGNTIDTLIPLSAAITSGSRLAAINTTAIDFGTTTICEERNSSVTISNKGCEADTILSGSFSSLQFGFDSSYSFPILLLPGSSITFPIFTHLDTTGHPLAISGALSFTLDSGVSIPAVTLTRAVTYPGAFALSLASETSAPIKAIVPVYVLRSGTVPSQASEVDFDLVYNDDLLSYNAPLQPDITFIGQTTLANGLTDRAFALRPATDRDTIATLQFQTYLTKHDSTGIQLTHQQFIAAGIISPGCVATMDTVSTPSNFSLELACGDSTILASWNETTPFNIESIQPNPARNEITVQLSGNMQPEIELYDALGREQDVRGMSLQNGVTLDVSKVPSGIYFLRVSAGGYVQSQSVAVEH